MGNLLGPGSESGPRRPDPDPTKEVRIRNTNFYTRFFKQFLPRPPTPSPHSFIFTETRTRQEPLKGSIFENFVTLSC
jgi:hypothetical protein